MLSLLAEKRLRRMKDLAFAQMFRHFRDTGDPSKTVILAASARSGSTWVQELLNYDGRYRVMFEPFWPRKVPELRGVVRPRQYLQRDAKRQDVEAAARRVLSGQIRNAWIDRFNRKWLAERRLVKDVRINLMLGWLRERFPEVRIILLLRHPCAVLASRQKMGWSSPLKTLVSQGALVSSELGGNTAFLETASEFERQIHAWCIENLVPLRHLNAGEAEVFFYEDLCTNLEKHLPRLFGRRGTPPNWQRAARRASRPSASSGRESMAIVGEPFHTGWTRSVSPEQRQRAAEILSRYGLDALYKEDALPQGDARNVLSRFAGGPGWAETG